MDVNKVAHVTAAVVHMVQALEMLNQADGVFAIEVPNMPYHRMKGAVLLTLETLAAQEGLSAEHGRYWAKDIYHVAHIEGAGLGAALVAIGTPAQYVARLDAEAAECGEVR